jgi:gliding motility-associated-like protein
MKTIALGKVLFLFLLIFSGWGANAQYFNDSIVIPAGNRNFSWCSASNDYIYVSDAVNDSIYVISICTRSIVASINAHSDMIGVHGKIKFSKSKLILSIDDYSVEMYDASNIFNITYLQTLSGFDQGWLESDPDDTTYFYWMEHWAQKIRIIDFSTGMMVTKSNPSTSGNVQGASRIGNLLYTGNAYQGSKRIDITDPANPVVTDFGGPAVYVVCTNNYILYADAFFDHGISLLNQAGTVLATKSPVDVGRVTRDNFAFVRDNLSTWKFYNIQNGSFDLISDAPRGFEAYNDNYWIGQESSKIVLYPRNTSIQASNITFSDISSNQFNFNWTDGTAAKRAVFIKQDSLGTAEPVNNVTYSANTAFGAGSQIGTTGWYCVFNGTTHSSGVTVTNLSPGKTYRVMVCEYNGTAGAESYNGSTSCNNPQNQTTCANGIPTDGLIAWYPFNGNANDESGNGHNGTVFGATLTNDRCEKPNSAYGFNGVNNHINLGSLNTPLFSHSFWVYKNIQTGNLIHSIQSDIGKNFRYVEHEIGVGFTFEMGTGTGYAYLYTGYSIPINSWHHIACLYDGDSIKVYCDGAMIGSKEVLTYVFDNADTWVGQNPLTGSTLDGKIDDIRVFNRALNNCEIQALYMEGNPCFVQASNLTFSNITNNQFTFNWTDGNGTSRAAFIKEGTEGSASPVNNTTYTPNTAFGSGSQIGTTGWYCVFNGTTHPDGIIVTNLSPCKTYRIMVCEYTGSPGSEIYNTSTAFKNPENVQTSGTIVIPNDGLVGYWPFNGNANDESGNGNNGTVTGATLTTDRFGNTGKAYYFDGINDKIDVPNSSTLNFSSDKLSISFWINVPIYPTSGEHVLINKQSGNGPLTSGFQIELSSPDGNRLQYRYADAGNGGGWAVLTIPYSNLSMTGTWFHVVTTTSTGFDKLYINGILVASNSTQHNYHLGSNTEILRFGGASPSIIGNWYYSGNMDDIRIYNRALNEIEIQALYREGAQEPIFVTSPNGGERWKVGDIHPITWTSCGVDNVKIEYSINSGTSWATIINDTPALSGSYSWTVPNTPSDLCLVKISNVTDITAYDVSDTTFQIYIEHQGSIINNDTTLCAGDTLQLNSRPSLTYRWYPLNGLSNDTIQNPILVVDSSRTYYLQTTELANNLVDNGDFEQGNTGFITEYTYCNTANCLMPIPDGYSVGTNANFYHSSFTGTDHTTGSGNFMIINGGSPTLILWKKIIEVTPNTNYAFGAWISTMVPLSEPGIKTAQIRFSINGTQLGPIYYAPDNTNQWDQVFIKWNSGSSTSAIIEIIDVLDAHYGNDFGLDDIFFDKINTNLDSIRITVGNAKIDLGPDKYLCKGSTMTLDAGQGFNSYSWNTGAKTQTIVVADSGRYSVVATRGNCTATGEIYIGQNPLPIVDLGPDKEKFIGQKLLLQSSTGPFSHYYWSTGDTSASISVANSGKYWLKVTDQWGCVGYDTVEVTNLGAEIRIPNAFTPNGDGYNDTFGPVTEGIETLEMKINDRYGRQVNIIDTVNGRWDGNMPSGSKAPQGVYFYLLKAMGYDQMEYVHQGIVNLYRDLIDLMPNPVKDKAVLDMSGRFTGEKIISIYNSSGSLVKTWTTMDDVHQFDLSFLRPGFYILRATNSEQVNVIKFIKE